MSRFNLFVALLTCVSLLPMRAAAQPSLIPLPASMQSGEGQFRFGEKLKVFVDAYPGDSIATVFNRFSASLTKVTGIKVSRAKEAKAALRRKLDKTLGAEAYTLKVTPVAIDLPAARPAGFFYALQTL